MVGTSEVDFDARDLPIDEILFREQRYRVPRYQRPYEWTIDQVSDFWNDLNESKGNYFIGSLIFNYEYYRDEGIVEIIDGQQRLLTVTILMAVLRDVAKEIGELELAGRIQRKAIAIEDRRGSMKYNLTCGDSTKEFFEQFVQSGSSSMLDASPRTREERHVMSNYFELMRRVREELGKHEAKSSKQEYLQKLWDRISELKVIRIKITNEDQAYEVFETVNARGLELSVADLLKNLIFRKIRPSQRGDDPAKQMWNEIQENVEKTDLQLTRFLRYHWLSRHYFVTERELFRAIKHDTKDFDGFLTNLVDDSNLFAKLVSGTQEDWAPLKHGGKILESLNGIRIMKTTQSYVLLLSIFRNYAKINSDPTRIVNLTENFTFNYSAVSKLPTNRVERMYSKYANLIERAVEENRSKDLAGNIQKIYSELEGEMKDLRPAREEFLNRFMEIEYGTSQDSRRLVAYILDKINRIQGTGEEKINFDVVNIEHILPQKPDKDWGLERRDIGEFVDKLGNLTLVHKRINSRIGNSNPKAKAVELAKSDIQMTRDLARELERKGSWTMDEIEARQRSLGELAYDAVWSY